MITQPKHIISRLNWHTTFNQKEEGVVLQNRLSNWSNKVMNRELNKLFDEICPPEQYWQIDFLDLDLGQIDSSELEATLSIRLLSQLKERLRDMVLHQKEDRLSITFANEIEADLEMVAAFLVHGTMSWNRQKAKGDLNQLLELQFAHHRVPLVQRLKTLGKGSLDVRKRMAWQFDEEHMVGFIKALEPNYHQEILDFSSSLDELQHKAVLVKAQSSEFHKNIWLWVLNFLLVDRGTTFNKVAFMLSSVNQMADHYNMDRQRLFELLGAAAHQITLHMSIRSDFMLILNEATKNYRHSVAAVPATQENAGVDKLRAYLGNIATLAHEKHRKAFNDLVMGLALEDAEGTKLALLQRVKSGLKIETLASFLTDAALESIYGLFVPQPAELMETVLFLANQAPKIHLKANAKLFRQLALAFVLLAKQQAGQPSHFLSYCFRAMGKAFQVGEQELLTRFLTAKPSGPIKTSAGLAIYRIVNELYQHSLLSGGPANSAFRFEEQLVHAIEQAESQALTKQFYEMLQRYIQLNPRQALAALARVKNKTALKKLLPKLLNDAALKAFVQNAPKEQIVVYQAIMQGIVLLGNSAQYLAISDALTDRLPFAVIAHGLLYPAQSHEQQLAHILQYGHVRLSLAHQNEFASFLTALFGTKAFDQLVSGATLQQLLGKYARSNAYSPLAYLKELLQQTHVKPVLIAQAIKENLNEPQIAELQKSGHSLGREVLNLLLKDGANLLERFIAESTAWYGKTQQRTLSVKEKQLLVSLFWSCALAYEQHNGQIEVFKKSLLKAFGYHFSTKAKISPTAHGFIDNLPFAATGIKLKNSLNLTKDELFELIENCLAHTETSISHQKQKLKLLLLFQYAMELDAARLMALVCQFETPKMANLLQKSGLQWREFNVFLQLHAKTQAVPVHEAMRLLFDWLEANAPEAITDRYLLQHWNFSLNIVQTGRPYTMIKSIFNELMIRLGQRGHTDVAILFAGFKERGFLQNRELREVLAQHPNFKHMLAKEEAMPNESLQAAKPNAEWRLVLMEELLQHREVPLWYGTTQQPAPGQLLDELLATDTIGFLRCLKTTASNNGQLLWLSQVLNFENLAKAIGRLNPNQQPLLYLLTQLHERLGKMHFKGLKTLTVQQVLLEKVLKAWKNNNWKSLSTLQIWNELLWELKTQHGYDEKSFLLVVEQAKIHLPLALQLSLSPILVRFKENRQPMARVELPLLAKNKSAIKIKDITKTGLEINNAGLVLLSGYVPMLFKYVDLHLPAVGAVPNEEDVLELKGRAVHYLQYLVTGSKATDEAYLALNKLLCGLPIAQPVPKEIGITPKEEDLMQGLIKSVIGHWTAIGTSSVDGFRGNWLMRKGLLFEQENRWELTVEKQPYDVLIQKLELSFSIIKFAWMEKPLHVNWTY